MTSSDDPFGRNDRTIIMPDPGGRRSAAFDRPAPPPPQPFRPSAPAAPVSPSAQPAFAPAGYGSAAGGDGREGEDWVSAPLRSPSPSPGAPGERGRALVMKRDVVVAPNENPFLRAAGPLLLLLGRLRVQLSRASFANLMEQVAAAIEDFEKDARGGGVGPDQTRTAKYIVCATADDIVQNIPTEDRHVWTQYSMLSRFFGERTGGVRFFEELERAKVDPSGNYYLLELIHAALALGFQGMHRTSANGSANLQAIQRNLYELLRRTRQADRDVSPRWAGQSIAPEAFRYKAPLWAVGAVTAMLLLGFYLVLRMLLSGNAEAAATAIATVHPTTELAVQRRFFRPPPPPPPPPPSSPAGQLKTALGDEVTSGRVVVLEAGNQTVLRIAAALFAPGDAQVKPEFIALLKKLSGLIERDGGPVRVVGHTDSQPIRTARFPSNFVLSEERAKAVAAAIKAGLSKPDRVTTEGKGADVPIAPNETVEGRARNRRVDIMIPKRV